ncbi:MAG: response regulator [Candidatus Omnitrophica bacterium]|nr:response regulator [Candidatus Omnitrophota bacterium]MDD5670421.1 response regulator [Candidatus Omnitrophota bacterium]
MAKILIVDDDQDVVEAMRVVLGKFRHEVVAAYDGSEGLEKTRKEKPDLIILDVMLPGVDGFEVAREIKKDERVKSTPILMLTAIKERTGIDFHKEAGDPDWLPVEDYCNKPLDYEVLIDKVNRLLLTRKTS